MGRELRRVPLNFDHSLDKIWYGFFMNDICTCMEERKEKWEKEKYCDQCREFARIKNIELEEYGCPKFDDYFKEAKDKLRELCEPPKGEGFQLWETTSEGSPVSPVFETLDELCEWCETNATTFANWKATKEQWKKMLEKNFVYHQEGNALFI